MDALAGKTALVTGAAGAIGSASALALAAAGARVILIDLTLAGLEATTASLPAGSASLALALDLADAAAVAETMGRLKDGAHEGWGLPDVLVNVAGVLSNNKLAETSLEEWTRVMTVNCTSAFLLCQACCPAMAERKWGRVINITSWAWKSGGLTAGTAYSTSKGAMTALTFSVARQYSASGVTANGVAPCYVFGPMITEALSEERRAELLTQIPVGKFCAPEEVAHAVLFLAHPLSGFITGEIIDQNGGFQMD